MIVGQTWSRDHGVVEWRVPHGLRKHTISMMHNTDGLFWSRPDYSWDLRPPRDPVARGVVSPLGHTCRLLKARSRFQDAYAGSRGDLWSTILPSARWVLMEVCVVCRCLSTCFVPIIQIELLVDVSNSALKICGYRSALVCS